MVAEHPARAAILRSWTLRAEPKWLHADPVVQLIHRVAPKWLHHADLVAVQLQAAVQKSLHAIHAEHQAAALKAHAVLIIASLFFQPSRV
jgi:hypothetical protein